ncbi:hypothetical protein LPJ74_004431 [Coemansia sp. RSA 1843]|nr:hypothetical protein LPJ74_004431 [Coemansia sp. RSA 1843]
MFIFPAVEDMEGTDEQMVSDVAELEILAKKLVELVPNVRYIRCTGPAMGIVSTAFQHNVINGQHADEKTCDYVDDE